MLEGIGSVGCGIMAPRKNPQKRPWVLDETLPRHRDPQEVMNEKMWKREVEKAKKKPIEDRNMLDYVTLLNDYLKNNPTVVYMA